MNKDIDGFELYGDGEIASEWVVNSDHVTIDATGRSGNCLKIGWNNNFVQTPGRLHRNMDSCARLFFGFAFRTNVLPPSGRVQIVALADAGQYLCGLWYDSVGRLQAGYLSSPSDPESFVAIGIPTPAGTIKLSTWRSLRIDITPHNSAGAIDVYVGRTLRISEAGVQTANLGSGAAPANQLELVGPGGDQNWHSFDDYWRNDESGDENNALWPDVGVRAQTGSANGHTAAWCLSGAASAWQCLATADGDTSYVVSDTADQVCLVALTPPPSTVGDILAIQTRIVARKDAVDAAAIAPMVSNGTLDSAADPVDLTDDYETIRTSYGRNPITGSAWSSSALETLQIGVKEAS
ncbi:MAG: hypothetical protein ABIY70_21225 [Capsulimonas sp.]|uniref:hypothetical protein n=1 Tax=Capsulimonas sp. TaxID=2494211 RepID=UPI0032655A4E